MERRDILKGSLLGITALGGASACLPRAWPRRVPDSEINDVLSTMEESLAKISRYDMLDDFTVKTGTKARHSDADRSLAQMSIRTLYTSATFRSLPEEMQLHPAVQEHVFNQLPEMDEAVYGMGDRMSTLDEDNRSFVRAALSNKKTSAEAVSQVFDGGMGTLRMPLGRRFQARSMFSKIGWRLQTQPALVIDEYTTKLQKASALVGSEVALQRTLAAQLGHERYWKHQRQLAMMFAQDPGNAQPSPPPTGVAPVPPGAPVVDDRATEVSYLLTNVYAAAEKNRCETVEFLGRRIAELDSDRYRKEFLMNDNVARCILALRQQRDIEPVKAENCPDPTSLANKMAHDKVVGTGGWMMGIGLITGLVSIALVGAANASDGAAVLGLIGLTVGSGLLVGGLIVICVGAGMASS